MSVIQKSILVGTVCLVLGRVVTVYAQTTTVDYKVRWEGSGTPSFTGAYAIIQQDGQTKTISFVSNKFPTEYKFTAPSTATISATGGSLTHPDRIEIKIFRNGQLCDAAATEGRGNYVTADCEPPIK